MGFQEGNIKQFIHDILASNISDGTKGIEYEQIINYVKELQLQGNLKPTAQEVIVYAKRFRNNPTASPNPFQPKSSVGNQKKRKKGKRKSKSIWTIRN